MENIPFSLESAFFRRNRIPHVKISGRRFIPRDVVSELIDKELALRKGSY